MATTPLLLTHRPWAELEQEGIATSELNVFFINKHPDHKIMGLCEFGVTLAEFQNDFKTKCAKLNYVVLSKMPGGDAEQVTSRPHEECIVFTRIDPAHNVAGHIDLAGKDVVLAAGELKVVHGKIKMVDNASGHYEPKGASARQAAIRAFAKIGHDISGVYVEKRWNGKSWLKVK